MAIRPQTTMGAFGHLPLALALFHDPKTQQALDPLIVAETFDFTPAESRVAVHLTNGFSIQEIADKTNVSANTIRTHLKSIFSKTNTQKQSDVVRLVLSMPDLGSFKQ